MVCFTIQDAVVMVAHNQQDVARIGSSWANLFLIALFWTRMVSLGVGPGQSGRHCVRPHTFGLQPHPSALCGTTAFLLIDSKRWSIREIQSKAIAHLGLTFTVSAICTSCTHTGFLRSQFAQIAIGHKCFFSGHIWHD
jgi:hypothetical protein